MESFDYLDSQCDIFRRWVSNYRDRTNIRINLVRDQHSDRGIYREGSGADTAGLCIHDYHCVCHDVVSSWHFHIIYPEHDFLCL